MSMQKSGPKRTVRLSVGAILIAVIAIGGAVIVLVSDLQGVTVRIRNAGVTTIENVVIHVTGNEYPIGSIEPGGRIAVKVAPTSASNVELEWTNAGVRRHGVIDCYIEARGYHGRILVTVSEGRITGSEDMLLALPWH